MEGCSELLSAAGLHSAVQKNARDRIKKEASERKRNVLYLICSYLRDHNLSASADCLSAEAQLSADVEVCDNIDLDTILQEYQSYYYAKFNKAAKITRPAKAPARASAAAKEAPPRRKSNLLTLPKTQQTQPEASVVEFQFEIRRLLANGTDHADTPALVADNRAFPRCLSDFEGYSGEWREMANVIFKEVVPSSLGITWGDCVGLQRGVELLKEAVIYPLQYPELFSGLVAPWRGILLYGPPGTGKTLLSKAVACETRTVFFNVTSSCFVNKWRGESEKMIKVLFDLARLYAPSTIFIDELDSVACGHSDYQHDASRRFKSELLVQIDGILAEEGKVFVLAATNKPWDLDTAILRRFEKRILVDLPGEKTRKEICKHYFSKAPNKFSEQDFEAMAQLSANFSGSDIKIVCREACMRKFRQELSKMNGVRVLKPPEPALEDVVEAIKSVRPVTNPELQKKYTKWRDQFGCH